MFGSDLPAEPDFSPTDFVVEPDFVLSDFSPFSPSDFVAVSSLVVEVDFGTSVFVWPSAFVVPSAFGAVSGFVAVGDSVDTPAVLAGVADGAVSADLTPVGSAAAEV